MFKRNLSKKHCRHMAFLTAFVLAFTNVGSCMTVSFAEEIVGGEAGGSGAGDVGGSGTEGEGGSGSGTEGEGGSGSGTEGEGGSGSGTEGEGGSGSGTEGEGGSGSGNDADGKNDAETDQENPNGGTTGNPGNPGAPAAPEVTPKENHEFTISYIIDPEEGAAVKGPSEAEEGESVIFTVKPEKGYVIDSVTADYMEVGLYEEARTASSSEAEYHGEPDFSKPQKYIIESVDADMEILIIMENEEALAEASVTLDDGTTVTAQWDAGIIPERAELDVREVTQEVKDAVIAGVEGTDTNLAEDVPAENPTEKVTDVMAYDITLVDGDTVYDTWEEGTVKITFSGPAIEEKSAEADKVSIFHVDEGNVLTEMPAELAEGDAAVEEIGFEAGHFSVYALAFIKGGSNVGTVKIVQAVLGTNPSEDGNAEVKTYALPEGADQVSVQTIAGKLDPVQSGDTALSFLKATYDAAGTMPVTGLQYDSVAGLQYKTEDSLGLVDTETVLYFWYGEGMTVNPQMQVSEIQQAVDMAGVIMFEPGNYKDLVLKIAGEKTLIPLGEVVFLGETMRSPAIDITGDTALTIGGGEGSKLSIQGYGDGIRQEGKQDITFTLEISQGSTLELTGNKVYDTNHGNGIWISGKGSTFNLIGRSDSTFIASDNGGSGVLAYGGEPYTSEQQNVTVKINFNGSRLVDMSRNRIGSGYHSGIGWYTGTTLEFVGCAEVHIDDNQIDAIMFSSSYKNVGGTAVAVPVDSELYVEDCPEFTMNGNESWGTNGGNVTVLNSTVECSGNSSQPWANVQKTASNLYCFSLVARDSEIRADNCGTYSGIWVAGNAEISGSRLYVSGNGIDNYGKNGCTGGYGILFGGLADISGSELLIENNGLAGIMFSNGRSPENTSSITDSTIRTMGNGKLAQTADRAINKSGIALYTGILDTADSNLVLLESDNRYGMGFEAEGRAQLILDGHGVSAYQAGGNESYSSRQGHYHTMMNGSLQAVRDHMSGTYSFNGVQSADEVYVAPVNGYQTKLTRFDLNAEINKEVGDGRDQSFRYLDPNSRQLVDYGFRYNRTGEDLMDGESGNAYVWAPVSILHYDATEGMISDFKTAIQGNVSLTNTRGDGTSIGNTGDGAQTGARYGTDYTVFGNSLNLSEGELPDVGDRAGYKFLGWYAADDEAKAAEYAGSGNWSALYGILNVPFTSSSKVAADMGDVGTGQAEKTIYAKWGLPSDHTITIHYLDKNSGASISASYTSGIINEGGQYNVYDQIHKAIANYTWDSYAGVQTDEVSGILTQDLVFNVYYTYNGSTGGGSGSGGGGGTSSGGRRATPETGGPGVTIEPEAVPLAPLPENTVVIPGEEVPLAPLPKTGERSTSLWVCLTAGLVLGMYSLLGRKKEES